MDQVKSIFQYLQKMGMTGLERNRRGINLNTYFLFRNFSNVYTMELLWSLKVRHPRIFHVFNFQKNASSISTKVGRKQKAHTHECLCRLGNQSTWQYTFLQKFSIFCRKTWNMSFRHSLFSPFTILCFENIFFLFSSTNLRIFMWSRLLF